MKRVICKISVLMAIVFIAMSCTKKEPKYNGIYKVRIPLEDGQGQYRFTTVELRSVSDIQSMTGSVANLKYGGKVSHEVENLKAKDWGIIDTKISGQNTPSAHFATVGDVLIPTDYTSLLLSTVMYHTEGTKTFYDGFNANDKLEFPYAVIVDPEHIFTDKRFETYPITNNAAYISMLDLFVYHPYKRDELPLGFNGGIVAHEYFHRIFHAKTNFVMTQLADRTAELTPDPQDITDLTPEQLAKVNVLLASALNEGLADYFAYEYSKNPAWMLPSAKKNLSRDVQVKKNVAGNKKQQLKDIVDHNLNEDSPRRRLEQHEIGSIYASFFYRLSNIWGAEKTKIAILNFLPRFAENFTKNRKTDFMSMGETISVFFNDEKLSPDVCSEVLSVFGDELTIQNFKPCKGFEINPPRMVNRGE
ncbi:MAG: hypothetical protein SGI74_01380 [Oligoflexia bacterium]|nr:hypothetical protein [Oligoflexia bacterium]